MNRRAATSLTLMAAMIAMVPDTVIVARADSTNILVTPNDGIDYQQPSLALNPGHPDRLAIAYMDGGSHRACRLARSADAGVSWQLSNLIGAQGRYPIPAGHVACWNPVIAYGPDGTLYYAFQTSKLAADPFSHIYVISSTDDGANFTPPGRIDGSAPPQGPARGGGDWWPRIATGAPGIVHVAWTRYRSGSPWGSSAIMVASSRDHASSFSRTISVSPSRQFDVTGADIAVGANGNMFVSWIDFTQWERKDLFLECADCLFGFTPQQEADQLSAFYARESQRLQFTTGRSCKEAGGITDPQLGNSMQVRDGDCEKPAVINVANSRDGGGSFTATSAPLENISLGCPGTPRLVGAPTLCDPLHYSAYDHNLTSLAAGTGKSLVMAWWDSGSSRGPNRISVSASPDLSSTWGAAEVMAPPSNSRREEQHRAAVSVAPNGRVDVVGYSTSSDGQQNVQWYARSSSNEGFTAPVQVSDAASKAEVGPLSDDSHASYGDHLAIGSTNDSLMAAWTDARNGESQAIVFARTETSRGGHVTVIVIAVSAALLLAAGGAIVARRRRIRNGPGSVS